MAASETIPCQEIADAQMQPEAAESVTVAPGGKKPGTNRLQRRFDRLARNVYQERDVSRALNILVERYDRLTRRQKDEIQELKQGLERALALIERQQKQRPIVPTLDRYEREK